MKYVKQIGVIHAALKTGWTRTVKKDHDRNSILVEMKKRDGNLHGNILVEFRRVKGAKRCGIKASIKTRSELNHPHCTNRDRTRILDYNGATVGYLPTCGWFRAMIEIDRLTL